MTDESDCMTVFWRDSHALRTRQRSGFAANGIYDLLRGVGEIVARYDRQARTGKDFFALFDIRPFKPDDKRHRKSNLLCRGDNPLGDDVALHDAAKNIDENPFHMRIADNNLERRGHFLA